jgi:hypothetical protein
MDLNHNPSNGRTHFNTSQFSENALGTPGSARRRFFSGPGWTTGLDNYGTALLKNVRLIESKSLQGFNLFNHAHFFGPPSRRRQYRQFHLRTSGERQSATPCPVECEVFSKPCERPTSGRPLHGSARLRAFALEADERKTGGDTAGSSHLPYSSSKSQGAVRRDWCVTVHYCQLSPGLGKNVAKKRSCLKKQNIRQSQLSIAPWVRR